MFALITTTLSASFVDCLNPSAIAQQFLLQAMVKKKSHTLYFIFGIGLANYVLGLAVYYGFIEWIKKFLESFVVKYPYYTAAGAVFAAVVMFCAGGVLIAKAKRSGNNEDEKAKTPSSLSPVSLFIMGAAFCAVELTSALPYFGFLAVLASYELALPGVLLFILIYDFVYVLPLLIVYFGYNKLQGTKAISVVEKVLKKASDYVIPVVLIVCGIFIFYKGITLF